VYEACNSGLTNLKFSLEKNVEAILEPKIKSRVLGLKMLPPSPYMRKDCEAYISVPCKWFDFDLFSNAGMILSAFIWGFLLDVFGRRKLIVIGFLLDFTFNFLASFAHRFEVLLVLKIFAGLS